MALIDCIECGSTVSDSAGSCPHCGHPVQSAEPARGSKLSELDIWFNDDGRIGPGQYWARYLTLVVIGVLLGIVGVAYEIRVGTLAGVLTLLSVYPSVALAIKRLHDRNMSGWVFLVSLVPLIGTVAWIVISVRRGTSGPNRYGPRTGYQWGEKDYQGEHSQLSSQIARTTRDESAIREFSSQRDWLVRKAVAENPHTPPGTLGRLASDSVPGVRAASARNPSLPSSILNRLAGDAEPVVSRAASETLSELAAEENAKPTDSANEERHTEDSEAMSDSHAHLVSNVLESLERLGSLREDGHLSEEEFESLKQQVLESSDES